MSASKSIFRHTPPEESEAHLWVHRYEDVVNDGKASRRTIWVRRKAVGRWPIYDEIKWVENRLAEREFLHREDTDRKLKESVEEKLSQYEPSIPELRDLQIWLAKERGGFYWADIARKFFPKTSGLPARKNAAAISAVRRAYYRVEKYLEKVEGGKNDTKKRKDTWNSTHSRGRLPENN